MQFMRALLCPVLAVSGTFRLTDEASPAPTPARASVPSSAPPPAPAPAPLGLQVANKAGKKPFIWTGPESKRERARDCVLCGRFE